MVLKFYNYGILKEAETPPNLELCFIFSTFYRGLILYTIFYIYICVCVYSIHHIIFYTPHYSVVFIKHSLIFIIIPLSGSNGLAQKVSLGFPVTYRKTRMNFFANSLHSIVFFEGWWQPSSVRAGLKLSRSSGTVSCKNTLQDLPVLCLFGPFVNQGKVLQCCFSCFLEITAKSDRLSYHHYKQKNCNNRKTLRSKCYPL